MTKGVHVETKESVAAGVPIFIGGAGRSGTTLLVDLIGSHSEISPVYETDFVESVIFLFHGKNSLTFSEKLRRLSLYFSDWASEIVDKPHSKGANESFVHGPHYLQFTELDFRMASAKMLSDLTSGVAPLAALSSMMTSLFRRHSAVDGKPSWVNKTPSNLSVAPELHQMFPDMKLIHCVRDPRDVACSVVERPWGPKNHVEAGDWWKGKVARGLSWGRSGAGGYMEVSYEQLLTRPAKVLDSIFDWIDFPLEGKAIVSERLARGIKFDCSRIERWKRDFPQSQYSPFYSTCGAEMNSVGYTQW